jgi:hypothetical protein
MRGKLEKIGNEWYVKYVHYDGGGSFRLPLYPNFVTMTDYVWVKGIKVYKGDEVEFTEVLVNPMGREVDPNNLGQNHSGCVWYAELIYDENEEPKKVLTEEDIFNQRDIDAVTDYINKETSKQEQKQHLIDMMESDEELGLYDESREIKLEDVFNDEKREGAKRIIHQHKVLKGLSLVNPAHLQMTSNGHGEFPDGYKLTEKGIQYIIEQLNKD